MDWTKVNLGAVGGVVGELANALERQPRGKGSAYARLIFGGILGWHMFYLEKTKRGVLYILSFIALMFGWVFRIPLLGYFLNLLLGVLGWYGIIPIVQYIGAGMLIVFFVFDLITLGRQVDKFNAAVYAYNEKYKTVAKVGRKVSEALSYGSQIQQLGSQIQQLKNMNARNNEE
jgi:TM2 domain-containing membrane protein YozV